MQPLAHTCPTGAVPVGKNVNLVRPDSRRRGRYRWKRWSGHVTGFFKPSRQQQVRTGDEKDKISWCRVVCIPRLCALCQCVRGSRLCQNISTPAVDLQYGALAVDFLSVLVECPANFHPGGTCCASFSYSRCFFRACLCSCLPPRRHGNRRSRMRQRCTFGIMRFVGVPLE